MPDARLWPGNLSIEPDWAQDVGEAGPAPVVRDRLAARAEIAYIEDWKGDLHLARRLDLPESDRLESAPDLASFPHVREDLATADWVVVPSAVAEQHIEQGQIVVYVAYHRGTGGGTVGVHEGNAWRWLDAESIELEEAANGPPEDDDADMEGPGVSEAFDRILRALTGGACSMRDVALASDHLLRLHPRNRDMLDAWEADLSDLYQVAEAQQSDNLAILAALDAAPSDVDTIELPLVGAARRVVRPAFQWPLRDGQDVLVPEEVEWWVDDVVSHRASRCTGEGGDSGLVAASPRASAAKEGGTPGLFDRIRSWFRS